MLFDWDGTGDGGISIPDGVYSYLISVQTNDLPIPHIVSTNSGGGPAPSPAMMSGVIISGTSPRAAEDSFPTSLQQARAARLDYYYSQPPPMPPVWTNGNWMNWEDIFGPEPLIKTDIPTPNQQTYATTAMASPMFATSDGSSYSGSSQSTRSPERKPNVGVKNKTGSFGVCYKTYGTNGFSAPHPRTGWPYPLPTFVAVDGQTATARTVDY